MISPDRLASEKPDDLRQILNDRFDLLLEDNNQRFIDLNSSGFTALLVNLGLEVPSVFKDIEVEGLALTLIKRPAVSRFSPLGDGIALHDIQEVKSAELTGWEKHETDSESIVLNRYMEYDLVRGVVNSGIDLASESSEIVFSERDFVKDDVLTLNAVFQYVLTHEVFEK